MMNREAAPFDKPELRRAVALTIDRKAFVDTLTEGKGDFGGAMLPPPEGVWGMPAELIRTLPGYGPDVAANRAEARKLMEGQGYGPNNRLAVKVSTRNLPPYRDPAVILIDQLKDIYIDGELELVDTPVWYPRLARKDFTIGLNLITPPEFMQALTEVNDPSARDIATFQNQIQNHSTKLLVYNTQTVTSLTEQLKTMAQQNNIPIVGVSETMPVGAQTFQGWQASELQLLLQALQKATASS